MYSNAKQQHTEAELTTMDDWESKEPQELQEIRIESLHPLIERFFSRLTFEEWDLLERGQPDDATKLQLAELILNLIILLSKTLLETLGRRNVPMTEDQIRFILGDNITKSFAQALDITDTVKCASSKTLTDLIAKELCESVKSCLQSETDSPVPKNAVSPKRLNRMVQLTCKMLKTIICSMTTLCKRCKCRKSRPCSTKVTEMESDHQEDTKTLEGAGADRSRSQTSSFRPETPHGTSAQSEDSVMRETTNFVQEIIEKEFRELAEPLFDNIEDLELLKEESSAEIIAVSKDVAQSIIEEASSLEGRDAANPIPQKEAAKMSLTKVLKKVHTLLARSFAKMSIHCMGTELKKKFHKDSRVKSRESVKSMSDSIDSLISKVYMENLLDLTKARAFPRLQDLTKNSTLVFTKELGELLYCYSTDGMMPGLTPVPPYNREVQLNLMGDIQASVWRFLGLMRWWLSFQARTHSDRVVQNLSEGKQIMALTAPRFPKSLKIEDHRFKKTAVRVLVEILVTKLFNNAKVKYTLVKPEIYIQHLFDKIWAEVKGRNFKITQKSLQKIENVIFKDLDKKLGRGMIGLILLDLENPEFENYIVSLFKTCMTPKRPSAFCRFFRTIFGTFSKC